MSRHPLFLPNRVSAWSGRNSGSGRRPWLTARRRDYLAGYLFIAPQLAGVMIFVIFPLALVGYYSFHEWDILVGSFTFVGFDNFQRLASDPQIIPVLLVTAAFGLGLVGLNLGLAMFLAVLLNQKLQGMIFFRTIFFSPVVVSLVAWTVVWGFFLQDDGGINSALAAIGVEGPNWLREGPTALASVIVVQVVKNVGLNMVLFLAAFQSVPSELYEAARVDGASRSRIFGAITLPLISPTILLALIITIVGSLQVFAQIAVLTQGGPGNSTTVLVYYLYQQAFLFSEFGYGSTLAILLFVIVLGLTIAQWQVRRKMVFHEN